jgi:hypothetical protein
LLAYIFTILILLFEAYELGTEAGWYICITPISDMPPEEENY